MSLPATDDFTGVDATAIVGRTTTTGSLTWVNPGGANTCQINTNRFYGGGSGGTCLVNTGVSDIIQSMVVGAGGQFNIMVFRSTSNASVKLEAWFTSGNVRLFDEGLNQIGSSGSATVAFGDTVSVEANGTSIILKVNGAAAVTTTSSHGLANTYHGIRDGVSGELYDTYAVDQFAVAAPTATLTKATPTAVYLHGTSGSGGTSPQWSRSTSPSSGFINLSNGSGISGATSDDLVDGSSGVAGGTRYYYVVTYSGSGASNVQSGGKWKVPAYVLFIGDSVTAGFGSTTDPVTQFAASVKGIAGQRAVITFNAGESGTHAYDWYDATSGTPVQSRLSTASANGISAGCTHAMVTLGINDSFSGETTAQFQANIAGIANYLLGQGYTAVILNYPTGFAYQGDGSLAKLLSLTANIDAVVNGSTILLGDTLMIQYLPDHAATELQTSGTSVHPNETGDRSIGDAWAFAWARAVGDVSSGGAGPVPMIGSPFIRSLP